MDKVRAMKMAADLRGHSIGGFQVGDYIGNGASAVVVSARGGDQEVALKLLDPDLVERYGEEQQLARIERQKNLIGQDHDHLVRIFGGGKCEDFDLLYLAMERLDFPALSDVLDRVPRDRIGELIRQVASAASFLESLGLVHRDIKPANIAISSDFSRAILLDFGVVRPLPGQTDVGAETGDIFLGTTRYSPPEYLMREEEDTVEGWRAVTFYQLGAVLHDLIMKTELFSEIQAPPARLIEAVRNKRPRVEADDQPNHLVSLARNSLEKDWRIRLKLLSWQSFLETPAPQTAEEVKLRISGRMAVNSEQPSAPSIPLDRYSKRRVISGLTASLGTIAREVCLQSGLFPPVGVFRGSGIVEIRTGPSSPHLLNHELTIKISVEIIDPEGLLVEIKGSAVLGTSQNEPTADQWVLVYKGESSSPSLRNDVDHLLHTALDSAQIHGAGLGLLKIDLSR